MIYRLANSMAQNVVVFGDSLSDIGQKKTTLSGRLGIGFGQMFVSGNGRFSDCGNWTDHMVECATHATFLKSSADETHRRSKAHFGLSEASWFHGRNSFRYANYAMGGAVGSTPFNKMSSRLALTCFRDQVNLFQLDMKQLQKQGARAPGNTLFIICIGANDIYTDERKGELLAHTTHEVATVQRERLRQIMQSCASKGRFVFVGLPGPMSIVRYFVALRQAVDAAVRASGRGLQPMVTDRYALCRSDQARAKAVRAYLAADPIKKERDALDKVIADIDRCELGCRIFNDKCKRVAEVRGDGYADIHASLNERSMQQIVATGSALSLGAKQTPAGQVSRIDYATRGQTPVAAIDGMHPTDPVYKLMWGVIHRAIVSTGWTFGDLAIASHV